ncbi:pentatricopeptide repeat-containing protein At1g09410, mitochondrial-like [Selaginella moellendorffii]|uniref:pentatricopeptide repeat-containing protein At1g09410, mitochondrial-like n=1 Tax=Selaginella moellendorffii TaxID=88036 RepID=UPI000D1C7EA0|nr:pentatricopeptide repeat-containing protein At1g09410, mitochondrial-like [Selaginella moellendorffii]|eukprot:XP_024535556.1 pentatricopeptide repeat-containing protein At1g09410, mitochondrial-like [Selaginella moellendorffii]
MVFTLSSFRGLCTDASSNYVEILRRCARTRNLAEGRTVHSALAAGGLDRGQECGNLLLQMYAKHNCIHEAREVFEKIDDKTSLSWNIIVTAYARNGYLEKAREMFNRTPDKCVSSWNTIITAYVKGGNMDEAKRLFDSMEVKDQVTWNLMITAYANAGHLHEARRLFEMLSDPSTANWTALIQGYGKIGILNEAKSFYDRMPDKNVAVRTAMVSAFAANGHIEEARQLFEETASRGDVGLWNTLICGYLKLDRITEACACFQRMDLEGIRPERSTFLNMLDPCSQFSLEKLGRNIHSKLTELRLEDDTAMATALLTMHGKWGDLEQVMHLFHSMVSRDVVAWTALITAFGGHNADIAKAREIFHLMPQWNVVSWTAMVTAYSENGHLHEALACYSRMPQRNRVSMTAIIAGYARNGYLHDAKSLFDTMTDRDVVAWTALINAHTQNWQHGEAIQLFRVMDMEGVRPNRTTFLAALEACSNLGDLTLARILHQCVLDCKCQSGMLIPSTLVNLYGKCGSVPEAKSLFERMVDPDMVATNAMLAALAQNGFLDEAKKIFDGLARPSLACWNAMITAYAQCGSIFEAQSLFDRVTQRKDVVTWTGMIKAYLQAGCPAEAFKFFQEMDLDGVRPNRVTFLHVCEVCCLLASKFKAKMVHAEIMSTGLRADSVLSTAIVSMYGRCGSIQHAKSFFDAMLRQYVEPWNALLSSYSQNGLATSVLGQFHLMVLDGLKPNSSTFVNVLAASSHAGLTGDGWSCFVSMAGDFGLEPAVDHYVCMVDILSRAGRLRDAEDLILGMPFEPEALVWTSLLGACREHKDAERGGRAAHQAFKLDPENSAPYALLSSIYKLRDQTRCPAVEVEDDVELAFAG